jgi:hypothetical protein
MLRAGAVILVLLCPAVAPASESTWFCAIVDPTSGKPEVVQYRISSAGLTVINWVSKLMLEFGGIKYTVLQVLQNNQQGVVAVQGTALKSDAGPNEISVRSVLIDKHSGEMRDTSISTLRNGIATEVHGRCTAK